MVEEVQLGHYGLSRIEHLVWKWKRMMSFDFGSLALYTGSCPFAYISILPGHTNLIVMSRWVALMARCDSPCRKSNTFRRH